MKLSIIIPCKNEEGNIIELHSKICDTLKKINFLFGIILGVQKSFKNRTKSSCVPFTQFPQMLISFITMVYL